MATIHKKEKIEKFLTKFDRGRLIIAGGGRGSLFPIYVASQAAKLTGCGMVVDVVPLKLTATLEAMNPLCKMYTADAIFNKRGHNFRVLENLFQHSKAVIIGPGMDWKHKQKREFTIFCLRQSHLSIIIDSDALDVIKENEELPKSNRKAKTVIVIVNFNESIKLLNCKTWAQKHKKVNRENIVRALGAFASSNSCYVLHKGYGFILFYPDGTACKFFVKSMPQMATAGMGDILAAFIGGFVAKGFIPPKAIEFSVVLRQKAAELYLKANPEALTVLPQNIISYTPPAFEKLRKLFSLSRKR